MTSITYQFIGDEFERAIVPQDQTQANSMHPKVEILYRGCHRLLFVNGHRIDKVLKIDTPRDQGGLAGVVNLSFVASEIVEREVSRERFDELKKSKAPIEPVIHQGEGIILVQQAKIRAPLRGYKFFELAGGKLSEVQYVLGLDADGLTIWVDAEQHGLAECGMCDWGVPVAPIKFKEVVHLDGPKQVVCYGRES